MALIRCRECGKEISTLATACPSCGAPPQSPVGPPPLPTARRSASRGKQLFFGTIAILTGVMLVLFVRVVTYHPITRSAAASATPAPAESTPTNSDTTSEQSASRMMTDAPITKSTTTSSSPNETTLKTSADRLITGTPITESTATGSPAIETAPETSARPVAAETPYASNVPVSASTLAPATYQVIGIPQGDYLNVRERAGPDYQVVTKLEPGTGGILLGTKRLSNGATTWQEITVHGQTGWVNAAYIGLERQASVSPTESSTSP